MLVSQYVTFLDGRIQEVAYDLYAQADDGSVWYFGEADFVTYWFEKARAAIEQGMAKRAGLLATQGIRGGANRLVLDRIKGSGDIFMAWPDEVWVVEGATVHVSIVGFDDGTETVRQIRGEPVPFINSNLTSGVDLAVARPLPPNLGISFMGDTKGGPFDIPSELAEKLLAEPNPDGRSNIDVVRPWVNGKDISGRPRNMWIIDFPPGTTIEEAALYEAPFEYVKQHIKPVREKNKRALYAEKWWIHAEARPGMRNVLAGLARYIATPRVSKHRLFVWRPIQTLADSATIVIARDDDFTFGLLHSRFHDLWARGTGTQLREMESGFRYTPSTTFETFPFPIAAELNERREHWLQPPDIGGAALQDRTLTNLYNNSPTWLQHLHESLDAAVAGAYGWSPEVSDEEILEGLLILNLERANAQSTSKKQLELS